MITWLLGTLMLWIPVTVSLQREGIFPAVFATFPSGLCLVIAYAALSGFGVYAGLFTVAWLVLRICRRINGAPFAVGDQVTILTGPMAGRVAQVSGHTRAQGGDLLPSLDFGPEARGRYRDFFEDYTLLRHSNGARVGKDEPGTTQA